MMANELHEILSDKSKKVSISELKKIIYALKQDSDDVCNDFLLKKESGYRFWPSELGRIAVHYDKVEMYTLCLEILEYLEEKNNE